MGEAEKEALLNGLRQLNYYDVPVGPEGVPWPADIDLVASIMWDEVDKPGSSLTEEQVIQTAKVVVDEGGGDLIDFGRTLLGDKFDALLQQKLDQGLPRESMLPADTLIIGVL